MKGLKILGDADEVFAVLKGSALNFKEIKGLLMKGTKNDFEASFIATPEMFKSVSESNKKVGAILVLHQL